MKPFYNEAKMKLKTITRLMALLVPTLLGAQLLSAQNNYCGTDHARQRLVDEHPEVLQQEAELEEFIKQFNENNGQGGRSGPYIIPIVFHIIHQGGTELLSNEQVRDQVRILNEDFNKRNADTASVIPTFKPIIGNAGIEFRLANIDPWGNYTNGINRINSSQTYMGNDFSKLEGWPRDKYLNVWVVRSMEDGVAGYAYYPGSVNVIQAVPNRDGIIILSNYIGSIGTGNYNLARALTHEIGHYLNLKHTWGDTNNPGVACGDDDVNDTPETKGSTTCNLNLSFCNPPALENVQNFMDYSYCSRMFTDGQVQRMIAALNSDKSDRNNLYTPANLAATGTDDTVYTLAPPRADITSNKRYICMGEKVTMIDASDYGGVDSYYWEFPYGIPAISTDKNPVVEFTSPGWQPVKLTVTNAAGSTVKYDTSQVYVGYAQSLYMAPFFEGFEDPYVFENGWAAVNADKNETSFKRVNFSAHSGNASAQLNNYQSRADHDIDELISPAFDLSGLTTGPTGTLKLSFYYSVASWSQTFNNLTDSISILASSNCGTNWVNIYKTGGTDFVNAGYVNTYFVPNVQGYWKYVNITLPGSLKRDNVRFRFQVFSSVRGNNFYIDDINIGNATISGVEDIAGINYATLYPNPAGPVTTLNLGLAEATDVTIQLTDITGKHMADVYNGQAAQGDSHFAIPTQQLAAGLYLVNIKAGNSFIRKKLMVQ